MTEKAAVIAPNSGSITLRFLELCQFRRLGKVQVDIDEKTTILVGANNSGKTSVLAALRHFLSDGSAFGAFDISLSQWTKLRDLGKQWEVTDRRGLNTLITQLHAQVPDFVRQPGLACLSARQVFLCPFLVSPGVHEAACEVAALQKQFVERRLSQLEVRPQCSRDALPGCIAGNDLALQVVYLHIDS